MTGHLVSGYIATRATPAGVITFTASQVPPEPPPWWVRLIAAVLSFINKWLPDPGTKR